jgi:hypothetical protein
LLRPCLIAIPILFLAAGPSRPAELTGVITQLQGTVRASGPGIGALPLVSLWQVVRSGVTLTLSEGAAAGIVCSNQRFVRIKGKVSWMLSEPACAAGKELSPAEYAVVAPQAGRFKVVRGLLVLDREMRTDSNDDPLAPVILNPRMTTVRRPRPTVSWQSVPSATEFMIQWTGPEAGAYSQQLEAANVSCSNGADGSVTCSVPWPADRGELRLGETFFLTVSAREGIVDPWHESETVEVRTQNHHDAAALEGRLRSLADLGLAGPALEAAQAGILADQEVYGDAAESYRRALTAAPSPELRVTLADVYFSTGLYRLAGPLYRRALKEGNKAVQAAAAFGLGRIEVARVRYEEAEQRFQQAETLYRSQELSEEAEAARLAAKKAGDRLKPKPKPSAPSGG